MLENNRAPQQSQQVPSGSGEERMDHKSPGTVYHTHMSQSVISWLPEYLSPPSRVRVATLGRPSTRESNEDQNAECPNMSRVL